MHGFRRAQARANMRFCQSYVVRQQHTLSLRNIWMLVQEMHSLRTWLTVAPVRVPQLT
jgi:hypothetical protein